MTNENPNQETVRRLFEYDPETGALIHRAGYACHVGTRAGTIHRGRRYIYIARRKFASARIVWLYVHGTLPDADVDHRDRDKLNDRISNLREATRLENCANKGIISTNKSGYKGVSYSSSKARWVAQISHNYKKMHLGYFKSAEEARDAYIEAATKLNGEFAVY